MPEILSEYIDRLCTVEMRFQGSLTSRARDSRLPRGTILKLYEAAREQQRHPLTYLAARGLLDKVHKGDTVIIAEGFLAPPWVPKGETDGPIGAASLARLVNIALDANPVLLTEDKSFEPLVAACEAAGVSILDFESVKKRPHAGYVEGFPYNEDEAKESAKVLIEKLQPSAIITLEKLGPNSKGVIHSVTGRDFTSFHAKVHHLIHEAKRSGILTIGIGDGGNEIGFGMIHEDVKKIIPFGDVCQCPCGSGVATVTPTDILVVAAVSNWGAYGLEASMAAILEKPELVHGVDMEKRMVERCAAAGGVDGVYGSQIPFVDGTPLEVQTSLMAMLKTMVKNFMEKIERPF